MGWKEPVQAKRVVFEGQGPERAYVQFCYCIWKQLPTALQRCCSFSWYQRKRACSPSCPVPWGEMRTASRPAASTLLQRCRHLRSAHAAESVSQREKRSLETEEHQRSNHQTVSSPALTLPAPWDPPLREEEIAFSTVLVLLLQELQLTIVREQLLGTPGLMGLTTGGAFRDHEPQLKCDRQVLSQATSQDLTPGPMPPRCSCSFPAALPRACSFWQDCYPIWLLPSPDLGPWPVWLPCPASQAFCFSIILICKQLVSSSCDFCFPQPIEQSLT